MDTLARIKDLAAKEFSIDPDTLDPDVPLKSLKIDSLAFLEFLFKVEEEFGVNFDEEELKDVKTLSDLERCVANAVSASSKA